MKVRGKDKPKKMIMDERYWREDTDTRVRFWWEVKEDDNWGIPDRFSELEVTVSHLLRGMSGTNVVHAEPSGHLQNLHRMKIRGELGCWSYKTTVNTLQNIFSKKLSLLVSDVKADDVSKMKKPRSSKHLMIALNIKKCERRFNFSSPSTTQ